MARHPKHSAASALAALGGMAVALVSCGGETAPKSKKTYVITVPSGYTNVTRSPAADKAQLLRLMNQYRRANGRKTLLPDARLMKAAQAHSEAMARHQLMVHQTAGEKSFQQRLRKQGYPQVYCAENIARARGAELVHRLWTESPGHRKNLMGKRYARVGIGLAGGYWTANYAEAVGPPSGAEMLAADAK